MQNQLPKTKERTSNFFFQTPIFGERDKNKNRDERIQSEIIDEDDEKFNKTVLSLIKFLKLMKKSEYSSNQQMIDENEQPSSEKIIPNQCSKKVKRKTPQTQTEVLKLNNNSFIADSSMEKEQKSKEWKLEIKSWENHQFYGLANQVRKNIFGKKKEIKLKSGCYGQIQLAYYIYYDQKDFYAPDPVLFFHKQRQKYSKV